MTPDQIRRALDKAEAELAWAQTAVTRASASAEAATPGGLTGYDPAILAGIRRKPNRKADERAWNSYSRRAAAQVRLDRARDEVARLGRRLEDATAEAARVHLTREDILGALFVQTANGWRKVVRVNPTSVSVDTGYSWVDRISFDKVLRVKRADAE